MNAARIRKSQAPITASARRLLEEYGLLGLVTDAPVVLYHGTTSSFEAFDPGKSRRELVDKYYGPGIFLSPSRRVAFTYAYASRNYGLELSVIDDLTQVNERAGHLLRDLYDNGGEGVWDRLATEILRHTDVKEYPMIHADEYLGVDPNDVADVARHIRGSKASRTQSGDPDVADILAAIRGGAVSGASPWWIFDRLDALGVDSFKYRPKIYTVAAQASRTLITASRTRALVARGMGYDCVVFHGETTVEGVPEVNILNPDHVRVLSVELA